MSASQARSKIAAQIEAGTISFQEACRRQDRIVQIVRMSIGQAQKQALFAAVVA